MEKSITYEKKMDRVEEVMNLVSVIILVLKKKLNNQNRYFSEQLNLKKCEKTIIGSAQKNIKGISGGEKRRLAFACEVHIKILKQFLPTIYFKVN